MAARRLPRTVHPEREFALHAALRETAQARAPGRFSARNPEVARVELHHEQAILFQRSGGSREVAELVTGNLCERCDKHRARQRGCSLQRCKTLR